VPLLIGSTEEQAKASAADFNLNITREPSDVIKAGNVIRQDPKAGISLPKGSDISIVVSRGPPYISLSDIPDTPVSEAQNTLEQQGITVNVKEEASKTVPQGSVIRTDPPTQVQNGGTVTLYASVGDKVKVPDVYKKPHLQAEQDLEADGLTVGSVNAQSCSFIKKNAPDFDCQSFPSGGVVSGYPLQWGQWADRGASIDIGYYDATKK
jgi:serine/threonine-protein kinase